MTENHQPLNAWKTSDKLSNYLHQLITSGLAPKNRYAGFPAVVISDLGNDNSKLDLAVETGVRHLLYGEGIEQLQNVTEESFLSCGLGRKLLNSLGWRHGTLAVVDFNRKELHSPSVQQPATSICLPYIWPEGKNLHDSVTQLDESTAPLELWTEVIDALPGIKQKQAVVYRLREFLLDPDRQTQHRDVAEIVELIVERTIAIADQFQLDNPERLLTHDRIRPRVEVSLRQYLGEAFITKFLWKPRARDYENLNHFLPRFASGETLTGNEQRLGMSIVKDSEITLTRLRKRWQHLFERDNLSDDKALLEFRTMCQEIGVLTAEEKKTPKLDSFVRWLLNLHDDKFRDPEKFVVADFQSYRSERWRHLYATTWQESRKVRFLRSALAILDAHHSLGVFQDLCRVLFEDSVSDSDVLLNASANIDVLEFLCRQETTERHYALFPLTNVTLKRGHGIRRCALVFASFSQLGSTSDRFDRIQLLRSAFHASCTPTILRLLEREEREQVLEEQEKKTDNRMKAASFVFGHDLKNRLDDMHYTAARDALRRGQPSASELCEEAFTNLDILYGTAEVFRTLPKFVKGILPRNWCDPEFLNRWPEGFNRKKHLVSAELACKAVIHQIVHAYLHRFTNRNFTLREINGSPQVVTPAPHFSFHELEIPPFDSKSSAAPVLALLAGLAELVRNAMRYLADDTVNGLIERDYGRVHLDYRIDREGEDIQVEMWNPFIGSDPPESRTIELMKDLYTDTDFVELHPIKSVSLWEHGFSLTEPYAYANFIFKPREAKFERKEY